MNKNLLIEISRTKEIMGLILEQSPVISLTDDIVKGLRSLIKKPSPELSQDIELLSQLATKGGRRVNQSEVVNLVTRLIRSNDTIAKYLIPKIIQNLDVSSQNYIQNFKTRIKDFQLRGGKYEDAIRGINANLNATRNGVPVFNTPIPEIKEYLKNDFEKYTWKLYNPGKDAVQQFVKSNAEEYGKKLLSGAKEGWSSKSGGGLASKSVVKLITPQKIKALFPNFFRKLTPEETKILLNWAAWGLPDLPSIKSSWKKLGFVGSFSNASVQILKKTVVMMFVITVARGIRDLFVDMLNEGQELEEGASGFWERFKRAFYLPNLSIVSPMWWLIGLIIIPLVKAGGGGDWNKYSKELLDYLVGKTKTPPPNPENLRQGLEDTINNIDTLTNRANANLDTLMRGENTDVSDIVPDSVISTTDYQSSDSSRIDEFKEFLKKKYPQRKFDNPKYLGNNEYKSSDDSFVIWSYINGNFITK